MHLGISTLCTARAFASGALSSFLSAAAFFRGSRREARTEASQGGSSAGFPDGGAGGLAEAPRSCSPAGGTSLSERRTSSFRVLRQWPPNSLWHRTSPPWLVSSWLPAQLHCTSR